MARNSADIKHEDRVYAAVSSDGAAKSALVASWQRSLQFHKLNPGHSKLPSRLTDVELEVARERLGTLISLSHSTLDRLYQGVGDAGCSVLLTDSTGLAVERRGATVDDAMFESWGLWTGSLWAESHEGTNGIGTCIVEQRPVVIHRDQHFYARNTLLSCSGAPIFNHEGDLAAVLDVSSCRADLTERFLKLISIAVVDAAARIEADLFKAAYPRARVVLLPTGDRGPRGLIAVDRDDLVIGATRAARVSLGLAPGRLDEPLLAADILGYGNSREDDLTADRGPVQRALVRAHGNVTEAAKSLGISRATLHRKLKKLAIPNPD